MTIRAPAWATISAITLNGTTGSPFRAGSRAETRRPPSVWFSATGSSAAVQGQVAHDPSSRLPFPDRSDPRAWLEEPCRDSPGPCCRGPEQVGLHDLRAACSGTRSSCRRKPSIASSSRGLGCCEPPRPPAIIVDWSGTSRPGQDAVRELDPVAVEMSISALGVRFDLCEAACCHSDDHYPCRRDRFARAARLPQLGDSRVGLMAVLGCLRSMRRGLRRA